MSSHEKANRGNRRPVAAIVALLVFACLLYFGVRGETGSWPETQCRIVASQVVRADQPIGPQGDPVALYKGEYQLKYQVGGREYFVWANAHWLDKDRRFVEDKVANLPEACDYRIRYNPRDPAQAFAR